MARRTLSIWSPSWAIVCGARSHHCEAGANSVVASMLVPAMSDTTTSAAPTTSGMPQRRSSRTGVAKTRVSTTATASGASSGSASLSAQRTAMNHRPLTA